jgi:hypothetical protein
VSRIKKVATALEAVRKWKLEQKYIGNTIRLERQGKINRQRVADKKKMTEILTYFRIMKLILTKSDIHRQKVRVDKHHQRVKKLVAEYMAKLAVFRDRGR